MITAYFSTLLTTHFKIYGETALPYYKALLPNSVYRGKNGELEQAIHTSQLIYSCLSSFGYFVYFMFSLLFFTKSNLITTEKHSLHILSADMIFRDLKRGRSGEIRNEKTTKYEKKNCRNERYNHAGIWFVVLLGFGYFI